MDIHFGVTLQEIAALNPPLRERYGKTIIAVEKLCCF
jgi:hypothetical protein